jgi:hypothetical protein
MSVVEEVPGFQYMNLISAVPDILYVLNVPSSKVLYKTNLVTVKVEPSKEGVLVESVYSIYQSSHYH